MKLTLVLETEEQIYSSSHRTDLTTQHPCNDHWFPLPGLWFHHSLTHYLLSMISPPRLPSTQKTNTCPSSPLLSHLVLFSSCSLSTRMEPRTNTSTTSFLSSKTGAMTTAFHIHCFQRHEISLLCYSKTSYFSQHRPRRDYQARKGLCWPLPHLGHLYICNFLLFLVVGLPKKKKFFRNISSI